MSSLPRRRVLAALAALGATLVGAASCTSVGGPDEPAVGPDEVPAPSSQPAGRTGNLVVHEWGTFTSMQGSDGASLDGLQHETESVPAFVHKNVEARESPFADIGDPSRDVFVRGVRSKMETPVIYFYSDTERRVSVEVDFVGGLLTHWYPRYAAASPEITAARGGPVDMTKLRQSTLRWDVDLVPAGAPAPREIPPVDADDAWQFARETGAATLRTAPAGEGAQSSATEADHYIFYRGLGRLDLPLQVASAAGGLAIVQNRGTTPVPVAIVLEMREGEGRYLRLPELPPNAGQPAPMGTLPMRPKTELLAALETEVEAALVQQGLFADEAHAMVRTWSRAWFASEGTRLLYVVPRDVTDRVLPLRISPRPDAMVRVLVGRHEYLTPEFEAGVEAALRARASGDPQVSAAAMKRLGKIGRFLEPAVRRAVASTRDEVVRKSGQQVLAAFR